MTWVLIVQLLLTGQQLALAQPSEAACRADLEQLEADIAAGIARIVILDDGLKLPVGRGIGCMPAAEFAVRRGGGI